MKSSEIKVANKTPEIWYFPTNKIDSKTLEIAAIIVAVLVSLNLPTTDIIVETGLYIHLTNNIEAKSKTAILLIKYFSPNQILTNERIEI